MSMTTYLLYGIAIGSGLGLVLGAWMVRRYRNLLALQADSPFRPKIKIQGRDYFMVPSKMYKALVEGKKCTIG